MDATLAACRDHDPSLWFATSKKNSRNAEAIAICETCPIVADCLAYSLEWASDGIWGGKTADQRTAIRREAKITLRTVA
jgi:WhiB family redox-sensing transcriptional regulator